MTNRNPQKSAEPNPHPIVAALAFTTGILAAETPAVSDSSAELAKKLANPIANLISVPLQNNFLFNVGPGNGFRETTNIQPVIGAYAWYSPSCFRKANHPTP